MYYEGEMAAKYHHVKGETGILISHGDPIAWLINTLLGKKLTPRTLTQGIYPKKGEGSVFVMDGRISGIIFLH